MFHNQISSSHFMSLVLPSLAPHQVVYPDTASPGSDIGPERTVHLDWSRGNLFYPPLLTAVLLAEVAIKVQDFID